MQTREAALPSKHAAFERQLAAELARPAPTILKSGGSRSPSSKSGTSWRPFGGGAVGGTAAA